MEAAIETEGDRRSILSAFADSVAGAGDSPNVDELVASYSAHVDAAVAAAPEMRGASNLLVRLRHAGVKLHLSWTPARTGFLWRIIYRRALEAR